MNKNNVIAELIELLEGYDKEFILQAMFNYFSTDELIEFIEFIKSEVNG